MARGVNKVILIGNLGQDPDVRYMPNGNAVTNITLATSETWKDRETGQPQERTEWHRVVFFGKLAEIAGQYLKKGAKIYVEGMLRTRKWQAQDGSDRYTTEVVCDMNGQMQMLDSNGGGTGGQRAAQQAEAYGAAHQAQAYQQGQPAPGSPAPQPAAAGDDFDDDIPF